MVESTDNQGSSTRPYLLRALHDWCTDNGFTPYVAVLVDETVQVPREHVRNNEIVLNISFDATSSLKLGNDFIVFKARFSGTAREIVVPINRVLAIYARENGQGMAFPAAPPIVSAGPSVLLSEALAKVNDAPEPVAPSKALAPTDSRVVSLRSEPASSKDPDAEPPPEPPKPSDGKRAALKRVK
jgi:stringent starvation protein B